jgi:uncharacterized paraquat-inducible protein A
MATADTSLSDQRYFGDIRSKQGWNAYVEERGEPPVKTALNLECPECHRVRLAVKGESPICPRCRNSAANAAVGAPPYTPAV